MHVLTVNVYALELGRFSLILKSNQHNDFTFCFCLYRYTYWSFFFPLPMLNTFHVLDPSSHLKYARNGIFHCQISLQWNILPPTYYSSIMFTVLRRVCLICFFILSCSNSRWGVALDVTVQVRVGLHHFCGSLSCPSQKNNCNSVVSPPEHN